MNVLAIIPARGGSRGIPRKNLAPCAGMPLIGWTWRALAESKQVTMAVLSSDDDEILATGPSTTMRLKRPSELAQDDTPTEAVIEHVLEHVSADIIVLLQPTSPIRTGQHIDEAIGMLFSDAKTGFYGFDSVLSVVPSHSFYWTGEEERSGKSGQLIASYDWTKRPRRQELPPQYEENGAIYVFTHDLWERKHNRLGERIGLYKMPQECGYQVDTPLDLYLCDAILRREQWVLKSSPKLA